MKSTGVFNVLAAGLLTLATTIVARPPSTEKKLIQFGAGEPDTAFMRKHIKQMEESPFDGCVFHMRYTNPDGSNGDFMWECWGKRAFTAQEIQPALQDVRATRFTTFTDNFVRFNSVPGDVDWFEDFSPVLNNLKLTARVAREAKCKGILLDTEQYGTELFNYQKQKHVATKSWSEYAAQAHKRGQEVVRVLQQEYPNLTIMTTFGFELPFKYTLGDSTKLPQTNYGLLAPFLNGIIAGADPGTRLVNGYQFAYAYRDPPEFLRAYRKQKKEVLPLVEDPRRYRRRFTFGFGVWMDYNPMGDLTWYMDDFTKNYFTPAAFEASVREALRVTDEYVWIFTLKPQWWSEEGESVAMPPEYDAALRAAKGEAR